MGLGIKGRGRRAVGVKDGRGGGVIMKVKGRGPWGTAMKGSGGGVANQRGRGQTIDAMWAWSCKKGVVGNVVVTWGGVASTGGWGAWPGGCT